MSNSSYPIAGNQYFQSIVNSTDNFTELRAASLIGPLNGGPSQVTFIGYSPSDFSNATLGQILPLMTTPDTLASATEKLLRIPINLLPILGQIKQQGTTALTATSTVTIGLSLTDTGASTNAIIIAAATSALVKS